MRTGLNDGPLLPMGKADRRALARMVGTLVLDEYEQLADAHPHGSPVADCGGCNRLAVLRSWINRANGSEPNAIW